MRNVILAASAYQISWSERLSDPFLFHPVPLVVSAIIGATLGLVGCFVVLRRMALLGDALSHAVLPGVAVAFLIISAATGTLGAAAEVWGLFAGALLAGLLTTVGISLVTRHSRVKEDTAIGIVFTAMFAVGVALVSSFEKGTHFDLKCFLWGEPLAIRSEDLVASGIIGPLVLVLILVFYRPLKLVSFDPQMAAASGLPVAFLHYLLMGVLSATVVTALQSVGVIMSVAMLITPAAVAYQLTNRLSTMLVLAAVAGAFSSLAGMVLAFALNLPPGPAMVIVATLLFMMTMLLAPEYGVLAKALQRRRVRAHILSEDVLKSLARLPAGASVSDIRGIVGAHAREAQVRTALRNLQSRGLLHDAPEGASLTSSGAARAEQLVRSHRLWETYLAEHKVAPDLLHDVAEELEHAHELTEEIATELGHPDLDPHGEPIPRPRGE